MSPREPWHTICEIVESARANLAAEVWDSICGGADSETTLRRNRSAFEYLALRPRVLNGVSGRNVSTTFLGLPLALPIMLAPVGTTVSSCDPTGALACARAAHQAGTVCFVGMLSSPTIEEVRAATDGPLVFQLYIRGDRDWIAAAVRRAESARCAALCVTVDASAYGRHERDLHNRFGPMAAGAHSNVPGMPSGTTAAALRERYQASLTWDDIAWLCGHTHLPVILKGIMTPEDAELAVQHGVAAIYVSNHGGRQLDHAPATIEVLPEIVQAVQGRAEVIVDSGFVRGSDVVKALAMGARAVLIGKLMLWGLAAGGTDGVVRALEILKEEIDTTMANIGVRNIAQIGPQYLRPSRPPLPRVDLGPTDTPERTWSDRNLYA